MPLPRLSRMTWLSDFIAPPHCERRVPSYAILIVPYIVPLLQSWLLFHAPVAHKSIPSWALRYHAQTLRLALLPVQILLCLHISFAYSGWVLTCVFAVALSLAAKSIDAATRRRPPSLAHADEAKGRPARPFYFPHTKLPLFVDYVTSWRGAGWESGIRSEAGYGRPDSKGEHKNPPQTLTDPRTIAFLKSRLKTFLCSAGLVAFALEVMRHPLFAAVFDAHPSILSPVNPLSSISPTRRVLVQTLFLLAQGISIPHPIQAAFSLLSIISTLISPQTQTWWTPLPFDSPHLSTSLHDFWGKRWHSFFSSTYQTLGYRPAAKIARWGGAREAMVRYVAVLGAFVASGLLHEIGQHNLRRSPAEVEAEDGSLIIVDRTALRDEHGSCYPLNATASGFGANRHATLLFFVTQAGGFLLEEQVRRLTGRKVSGWPGRIWTVCFIGLTSRAMTRSWVQHGFQEGFERVSLLERPATLLLKGALLFFGGVRV